MKIRPFQLNEWFTRYELSVRYDLADSGVSAVTLKHLLTVADGDAEELLHSLLDVPLSYGETNGFVELRNELAQLHPGCRPDQILVTTGTIEGLFLALNVLLEAGDRVVLATPAHEPLLNTPLAIGCEIVDWPLVDERRWRYDLDALDHIAPPGTKLILLNTPHNPTGATLSHGEMVHILSHADRIGAWVVNDEVYRDLPHWDSLAGNPASPVASHSGGVSIASLSKSLGLPGLRLGWIAGPPDLVARCWDMRGYTTLSPPRLSQTLALVALRARRALLDRAAAILSQNHATLKTWVRRNADVIDWVEPSSGPLTLVDYLAPIPSDRLGAVLAQRHGVLVVPGTIYDRPQSIRLGLGSQPEDFATGLTSIEQELRQAIGTSVRTSN